MDLREKIARAIVKARLYDADPDTRVFPHRLVQFRDGMYAVPPADHTMALWESYGDAADAALETVQRELEAAGIIVAWPKEFAKPSDNP